MQIYDGKLLRSDRTRTDDQHIEQKACHHFANDPDSGEDPREVGKREITRAQVSMKTNHKPATFHPSRQGPLHVGLTNSIWFRIEIHNFCIARLVKNDSANCGDITATYYAKAGNESHKCRKFFQYIRFRRLRPHHRISNAIGELRAPRPRQF